MAAEVRAPLLLALLLAAPPLAASLLSDMRSTGVRVVCLGPGKGAGGIGSGFVVGRSDHVVTNWHVAACTEHGGRVGVVLGRGEVVKANVRWHAAEKDLAVLRLEKAIDREPARFASGAGAVGWADEGGPTKQCVTTTGSLAFVPQPNGECFPGFSSVGASPDVSSWPG